MIPSEIQQSMRASPIRLLGALVLFFVVAAGAAHNAGHRYDVGVTVWLQRAAPVPDLPASLYVFAGDGEVLITGAVVAGLILVRREPRCAQAAFRIALGLAALSLIAVGLKHLLPHPGPPDALQRHVFRAGISIAEPYSFPSGHTLRTTFLAGTVLRRTPLIAVAALGAMMASLVYLGDHWTSDVLGGLCLGWAAVEAARMIARRAPARLRTTRLPSYRRG
jgi:membrane-associated phospholipid phosphatase